ncbi:MAG: fused MFS/spermidine synthase [Bowdeniella nasicola]|nr:fused MFS/spermidine synthase [Bowdeniella nasicola]
MHAWPTDEIATSTGTLRFEPVTSRAALLVLDGMESSYIDLDHPNHLEFEYMQHMSIVTDVTLGAGTRLRALHLGGAGCALARAWAAERPGSAQTVIEWDALLAELAREYCDIPRAPAVKIRVAEARASLERFPPGRWDVIVRDTFANAAVPEHMRTIQVARAASRALIEEGLYLVNLTDHPPLTQARREVATLREVFAHVTLISESGILRGRRHGNVVLAASNRPLNDALIARRCRALPLPVAVLSGSRLASFGASAQPFVDP